MISYCALGDCFRIAAAKSGKMMTQVGRPKAVGKKPEYDDGMEKRMGFGVRKAQT